MSLSLSASLLSFPFCVSLPLRLSLCFSQKTVSDDTAQETASFGAPIAATRNLQCCAWKANGKWWSEMLMCVCVCMYVCMCYVDGVVTTTWYVCVRTYVFISSMCLPWLHFLRVYVSLHVLVKGAFSVAFSSRLPVVCGVRSVLSCVYYLCTYTCVAALHVYVCMCINTCVFMCVCYTLCTHVIIMFSRMELKLCAFSKGNCAWSKCSIHDGIWLQRGRRTLRFEALRQQRKHGESNTYVLTEVH